MASVAARAAWRLRPDSSTPRQQHARHLSLLPRALWLACTLVETCVCSPTQLHPAVALTVPRCEAWGRYTASQGAQRCSQPPAARSAHNLAFWWPLLQLGISRGPARQRWQAPVVRTSPAGSTIGHAWHGAGTCMPWVHALRRGCVGCIGLRLPRQHTVAHCRACKQRRASGTAHRVSC